MTYKGTMTQVQAIESTDAGYTSLREQHPAFDMSKHAAH